MNPPQDIEKILTATPAYFFLSGVALLLGLGWEALATKVNENRRAHGRVPLLPVLRLNRQRVMEETGWGNDAEWFRPGAFLSLLQHEPLAVLPWLFAGGVLVFGYPEIAQQFAAGGAVWRFIADWIFPDPYASAAQRVAYWVVKVYWCAASGLFFASMFLGVFLYGVIAAVLLASVFVPIFLSRKERGEDE